MSSPSSLSVLRCVCDIPFSANFLKSEYNSFFYIHCRITSRSSYKNMRPRVYALAYTRGICYNNPIKQMEVYPWSNHAVDNVSFSSTISFRGVTAYSSKQNAAIACTQKRNIVIPKPLPASIFSPDLPLLSPNATRLPQTKRIPSQSLEGFSLHFPYPCAIILPVDAGIVHR